MAPRPLARVLAVAAVAVLIGVATTCVSNPPPLVRGPAPVAMSRATDPPPCPESPLESLASYAPDETTTAEVARTQTIRPGVLVVGVSADTYGMGFRDPVTTDLRGFDVDLARAVAGALFGDPDRIQYTVVNFAQRLPALQEGRVDLVIHSMTITCERWREIDFSTEYLRAGRRLLVSTEQAAAGVRSLSDLVGRRVCATAGGTAYRGLTTGHTGLIAVGRPDVTDCMVAFQLGEVDAIVSDDTILAGFVGQDPLAVVVGDRLSEEPYGIGVRKGNLALTRFVNLVLEQVRADHWRDRYDHWLGHALGPAEPPPAVYGREMDP
jgi:polar amino acid transport system substrate-binding protein